MRVAIASMGYNLDSDVSPILGGSTVFIVVNLENNAEILTFENNYKNKSGSGNLSAQWMIDNEIDFLISGKFGPAAFSALKNAGIKVYNCVSGTAGHNLKLFKNDKLKEVTTLAHGF